MTVIQVLVLLLYLLSFCFVLSAALLESGIDLSSLPACRAAIYCCLSFYFLSKGVIQIFLAERAHAVRARHPKRLGDPLWMTCMFFIIVGFGAIMILAFIYPVAEIGSDNICRIGLPMGITIPMLSYDILINAALTGIFIWLLQPLAKRRLASETPSNRFTALPGKNPRIPLKTMKPYRARISSIGSSPAPSQDNMDSFSTTAAKQPSTQKKWTWVDKLVFKSMLAAVLVLLPTLANLGLLTHLKGREQGWECLTFCTLDGRLPNGPYSLVGNTNMIQSLGQLSVCTGSLQAHMTNPHLLRIEAHSALFDTTRNSMAAVLFMIVPFHSLVIIHQSSIILHSTVTVDVFSCLFSCSLNTHSTHCSFGA